MNEPLFRCRFCDALFESGDATPRCPQCGLGDVEPAAAADGEPVICQSAWFQ